MNHKVEKIVKYRNQWLVNYKYVIKFYKSIKFVLSFRTYENNV